MQGEGDSLDASLEELGQCVEFRLAAPRAGKYDLQLYCMPDCWVGCDRVCSIKLKVRRGRGILFLIRACYAEGKRLRPSITGIGAHWTAAASSHLLAGLPPAPCIRPSDAAPSLCQPMLSCALPKIYPAPAV